MKRKFTTTVCTLLIALVAFSNNLPPADTNITRKTELDLHESGPGIYNSGWESVSAWASQREGSTTTCQFNRPAAEITASVLANGVVLVFARNLWTEEPSFVELGAPDKPIKMPFYFLPDFDKPDYSEMWSFSPKENAIQLTLQVKGANATWSPGTKVEFRYMVISREALQRKGQTVASVRKMPYNDVVETFALN
ncbi:hypothetical protein V9K67_19665 [Paraflavisolibacter sp. H34]|uniref:hypothetical protein n=1 Tax=Huijunlia imazamoxiresistens TaxID=3127457 RepID=UPI00301AD429